MVGMLVLQLHIEAYILNMQFAAAIVVPLNLFTVLLQVLHLKWVAVSEFNEFTQHHKRHFTT